MSASFKLATPQVVTVASYQVQGFIVDLTKGAVTLKYTLQDQNGNQIGVQQSASLPNTQLMVMMPAILAALEVGINQALGVSGTISPPPPANAAQVNIVPTVPTVVAGVQGTGTPPTGTP
jgi:hypothetical protein